MNSNSFALIILSNIIIFDLLIFVKSQLIYKAPPNFCAYKCGNGAISGIISATFTCTTPYPLKDFQKAALVLTQHSREITMDYEFDARIMPATTNPVTAYDIFFTSISTGVFALSFTIIAIGIQSYSNTQFGLCQLTLRNDINNNMANNNLSPRGVSMFRHISIETQFTQTAGLTFIPYISSFNLNSVPDNIYRDVKIQVTVLDSFLFQVAISVPGCVGLFYGRFTVFIYSSTQINKAGLFINGIFKIDANSRQYDLRLLFPDWGPKFNTKCILGFNQLIYNYYQDFNLQFQISSYGNYYAIKDVGPNSFFTEWFGNVFCVTDINIQCGQTRRFYDKYENDCFNASGCPVPRNDPGYPYLQQNCPLCFSEYCLECSTNRSYCNQCSTTSHTVPVNGTCVCDSGYYNNTLNTGSLDCDVNCTYFIPGCQILHCSSLVYCSQCINDSYYLISINASHQNCQPCSTNISNCKQCLNPRQCTNCQDQYYLHSYNLAFIAYADCLSCNSSILNCRLCSSNISCSQCHSGYDLVSSLICQCNPANLSNCQTCNTPTQCSSCDSGYFVNQTTFNCDLCTNLFQCTSCTSYKNCTSCNQYYYPVYNPATNISRCQACSVIIPYCQECSSLTSCDSCTNGSAFSSSNQCNLCSNLIPGCLQCLNYTYCTQCQNDGSTFFVNNTCLRCSNIHPSCISCTFDNISLTCTSCSNGYFLDNTTNTCKKCSDEIYDCLNCIYNFSTLTPQCTLCSNLFDVDSNFTCQKCKDSSLIYSSRTCNNITGCTSSIIFSGQTVCIACNPYSNFQYNFFTKTCECQTGFYLNGVLRICEQKCGDGIKVNMECDDGNLVNGDGCSDQCTVQQNFVCYENLTSLSSCVLEQDIQIIFEYIVKNFGQNKATLYFTVKPSSTVLNKINWRNAVIFDFSQPISTQISYSNGILIVQVQYNSDIQQKIMNMTVNFDPTIIKSKNQSLTLKLNALNGQLIYQSNPETYKTLKIFGLSLSVMCLLVYLISSYFHKMIGLELIQFLQFLYFVRIISSSVKQSSFYGLNGLKYSNGYNDITENQQSIQTYKSLPQSFLKMNLSLYFLDNCNMMLIPVVIASLVFSGYLIKKIYYRSLYTKTRLKEVKDRYTVISRKMDWVYDSFIFSFTLSLLYIAYFSTLGYLNSKIQSDTSISSFYSILCTAVNLIVLFYVASIFCFQTVQGIRKFNQLYAKDNVVDDHKNIDHDENGNNYGYHPLYVPIYLLFQFLNIQMISFFMTNFQYLNQIILSINIVYLILIIRWQPYSQKIHNFAIILNQSTIVSFTIILLLFKANRLPSKVAAAVLYIIYGIIFISIAIHLIRLYIHKKSLQRNKSSKDMFKNQQNDPSQTKKVKLTDDINNPYLFKNQLRKLSILEQINIQDNSFIYSNQVNQVQNIRRRHHPKFNFNQQKQFDYDRNIPYKRKQKIGHDIQLYELDNKINETGDQITMIKNKMRREYFETTEMVKQEQEE